MSDPAQIDVARLIGGELRLPIFPVSPGAPYLQKPKHPLTEHGFKDATTDPDQIEAWWRRHPKACIGLRTGQASGLIVVDVDTHGGDGFASLRKLAEEGLVLPPTLLTVSTPSGGMHLYFRAPAEPVPGRKLAEAIDLKSDGGYVLAPGSVMSDGRAYRFIEGGADALAA